MKKLILLILPLLVSPTLSFAESYGDYQGDVCVSNFDEDTIKFNIPGLYSIMGGENIHSGKWN